MCGRLSDVRRQCCGDHIGSGCGRTEWQRRYCDECGRQCGSMVGCTERHVTIKSVGWVQMGSRRRTCKTTRQSFQRRTRARLRVRDFRINVIIHNQFSRVAWWGSQQANALVSYSQCVRMRIAWLHVTHTYISTHCRVAIRQQNLVRLCYFKKSSESRSYAYPYSKSFIFDFGEWVSLPSNIGTCDIYGCDVL